MDDQTVLTPRPVAPQHGVPGQVAGAAINPEPTGTAIGANSGGPTGRFRARRLTPSIPQVSSAAVLLVLGSLHSLVVWPGRMSNDTLIQIAALRDGSYTDWHAGLLLVLWRPFWLLGVGPGWVTWASTIVFLFGLYSLVRCALPRAAAVVATVLVLAYPPVLGHLGYLGRDLWYTAFFLAAGAALLRLTRVSGRTSRITWAVAVVAGVWLLVASRQNAVPAAGVLLWAAVSSGGPWSWLGRFDRSVGAVPLRGRVVRALVALVAMLALLGTQWGVKRLFQVRGTHPEQATYIYDVAALSLRERSVLFSPEVYPAQDLARLEQRWSTDGVNPLLFPPEPLIVFPLPPSAVPVLRQDWLSAIRDHPRGYLAIRYQLWTQQIAWRANTEWIYHPGVDPNEWGYTIANPSLDEQLQRYLRASASNPQLTGGPLYEIWIYLLVTAMGLAYLGHGRRDRQMLGWLCLASLAYQATIFLGAMGIGYRLTYPAVVLSLPIALVGALDVIRWALVGAHRNRSTRQSVLASEEPC